MIRETDHTQCLQKCPRNKVLFTVLKWYNFVGIFTIDSQDIGVELGDELFDGCGLGVFHKECLVFVECFAVLDVRLVSFFGEYCVRS